MQYERPKLSAITIEDLSNKSDCSSSSFGKEQMQDSPNIFPLGSVGANDSNSNSLLSVNVRNNMQKQGLTKH